jgi:hypothetical protein
VLRLSFVAQLAHAGVSPQCQLFAPGSLFWASSATVIPRAPQAAEAASKLI